MLEEKLFFEKRIWTLKGWKEYCSIDDSDSEIQNLNFVCTQGHSYVVLLLCTFILQIKKDKAFCCSVGVSYSSTSHVSKGLSNLT